MSLGQSLGNCPGQPGLETAHAYMYIPLYQAKTEAKRAESEKLGATNAKGIFLTNPFFLIWPEKKLRFDICIENKDLV